MYASPFALHTLYLHIIITKTIKGSLYKPPPLISGISEIFILSKKNKNVKIYFYFDYLLSKIITSDLTSFASFFVWFTSFITSLYDCFAPFISKGTPIKSIFSHLENNQPKVIGSLSYIISYFTALLFICSSILLILRLPFIVIFWN